MDLADEVFGLYLHPDDRLEVVDLDFIRVDALSFILSLDEHIAYLEGIVKAFLGRDVGWLEFLQRSHHLLFGKLCDLLSRKCAVLERLSTSLVASFEGYFLGLFVLVEELEQLIVLLLRQLLVLFCLFLGIEVDVVVLIFDSEAVALAELLSLLFELVGLLFVKLVSFANVANVGSFLFDFAVFHFLEVLFVELFEGLRYGSASRFESCDEVWGVHALVARDERDRCALVACAACSANSVHIVFNMIGAHVVDH